jgi:nucleoside triphosphatase
MAEQSFPEPTVGALVFDSENRLFLIRSHKWFDKYVIPGGHVELGETLEEALRREIKEETNLVVYDIEFLFVQEFIYDNAFWKQRHFIFLDYTCKTRSDKVVLNSEGQGYVWVTIDEALELPIDSYTEKTIDAFLAKKRGKCNE